jgi:hypothetical protein
MALPKTKHPLFDIKIPSTSKAVSFRPFLVKEEKILLMAKASEDPTDIFKAIKQVINNCAMDKGFDINKLAIFDLEYVFIRLRAISVNNVVKVSYRDNEDNKVYDFEINLDTVEVIFPENISKNIKISDTIGMNMKYPPASIFDDKEYFKSGDNAFYELIIRCVDMIYDGDEVYDIANVTKEELENFLDEVGINAYQEIVKFMENTPKIVHVLKYKNTNGNDRTITLNTITDFFTLG